MKSESTGCLLQLSDFAHTVRFSDLLARHLHLLSSYRPAFRWHVPLPSSAPNSRTVTTDDCNSRSVTSTDVTGIDEVCVSVRRPTAESSAHTASSGPESVVDDDETVSEAVAGSDGLRRRHTSAGATGRPPNNGSSASPSASLPTRKLYAGRPAGRINRIKAKIAARNAARGVDGGSADLAEDSTVDSVSVIDDDDDDGAAGSSSHAAKNAQSHLSIESVCEELGLQHLAPRLAAEALTPAVLRAMAFNDAARARAVLAEAGVNKLGHREEILLAVTRRAEPSARPSAVVAPSSSPPQLLLPSRSNGSVLGVRNPALRKALGELALADIE